MVSLAQVAKYSGGDTLDLYSPYTGRKILVGLELRETWFDPANPPMIQHLPLLYVRLHVFLGIPIPVKVGRRSNYVPPLLPVP